MKFTLNEPAWYSQNYELDKCLKEMSQLLSDVLVCRIYGEVDELSITPTVAPKVEYNERSGWLGYIHYVKSIKTSFIFHPIDYNCYMCGTVEERKKLTIKCIIEAVEMFKQEKSAKFPINQFIEDVLKFSGYSIDELNNIDVIDTEFRVMPNKEILRAKELSVKFNDSNSFRNDPISRTILSQYIGYIKTQTNIGNSENVTLTDLNTKVSIQASLDMNVLNISNGSSSFLVKVFQETQFGEIRNTIVEHLTEFETIKLFGDFYDNVVIDTTYITAIMRARELEIEFANEMPFKNQLVARSYLKDYIRYVEIQSIHDNPEFVTIVDRNSKEFIQAAYITENQNNLDDSRRFLVEIRYMNDHNGGKGDFVSKYLNNEETLKAFEDFFDRIPIDLADGESIINQINWSYLEKQAENNQSNKPKKSLLNKLKDMLSSK